MGSNRSAKEALANWIERRDSYEYELSVTTSPALKYELKKQIEECDMEIEALGKKVDGIESGAPSASLLSSLRKRRILILSANPIGTSQLLISQEIREIRSSLLSLKEGCLLSVESIEAIRYRDVFKAILEYEPDIVHFSGHGSKSSGIIVEDMAGQAKKLDPEALAKLFELFSSQIECVVLNACHSYVEAEAIAQHIRHVIGMRGQVEDRSAIEFSIGFYGALASGRTYAFAYELGRQAISLSGNKPDSLRPYILGVSHIHHESKMISDAQELSRDVDLFRSKKWKSESFRSEPFQFTVVNLGSESETNRIQDINTIHFLDQIDDDPLLDLDLVLVPEGGFRMGSSELEEGRKENESPQHLVEVSSFYMSRSPITQAQWYKVATFPQVNIPLTKVNPKFRGESLPMEGVSWYEALEFCARLSNHLGRKYRLPSEAQWEYACRAGTTTRFHFGDVISTSLANYNSSKLGVNSNRFFRGETTPVGFFGISNPFGLSDMHGNISEWCMDPWHKNYVGAPCDGSVWDKDGEEYRRVVRGGAYNREVNDCRSATRYFLDPNRRSSFVVGLRVVFSK